MIARGHIATDAARLLLLVALTSIATGLPAQAHEVWLLSPIQIADLATRPQPDVFTQINPLALSLGLIAGLIVAAATFIDRYLLPVEQRLIGRLQPGSGGVLLDRLCRWGLALLFLTAALGLAPRHGTSFFAQPTLFVADLELTRAGPVLGRWLVGVQVALGVLLVANVLPRIAAAGVFALVAVGYGVFGPDMNAYAGHLVAPALVVLLMPRRLEWRDPVVTQRAEAVIRLFRVLVGINFVYLAVVFKIQQPNLIISIIETGSIPTFGIPTEVIAYVMALVELVVGILMIAGVAVRPAALAVIGAMVFFSITLREPPHVHANIIGAVVAMVLAGPRAATALAVSGIDWRRRMAGAHGRIKLIVTNLAARPATLRLPDTPSRAGFMAAAAIAAAGFWTPFVAASSGGLPERVFHEVAASEPAPTLDFEVVALPNGSYAVEIKAPNFKFIDLCSREETGLIGHAHVYVNDRKAAVARAPFHEIGPLPPGRNRISISLNTMDHRFIVAQGQALIASKVQSDTVAVAGTRF